MDYRALIIVPLAALVLSVSAASPRIPDHWQGLAVAHTGYPSQSSGYDIGLDSAAEATGTPTVTIRSTGPLLPVPNSFGALTQAAAGYAGRRIRFTAEVRAEGATPWAGAFVALGDTGQLGRVAQGAPDVEHHLPAGRSAPASGGWRTLEVVVDVPRDAPLVSVGVALVGEGQLWARKLGFEVVGEGMPVTKTPIGFDWAAAREALANSRRVMAGLPPQPLANVALD